MYKKRLEEQRVTPVVAVVTAESPACTIKGRTKFTTSGAHDIIAITSPQKNEE